MNSDERILLIEVVFASDTPKYPTLPIDAFLYLQKRPSLLGTYANLFTLALIGFKFKKQQILAETIGLDWLVFCDYKNQLVRSGLLTLVTKGTWQSIQLANFYEKPPLALSKPMNATVELQPETATKEKQLVLSAEIAEEASIQAKEIVKKQAAKKKREEQKFPKEDYGIVLQGYSKYTGIGFKGVDYTRALHDVKDMFRSGHKPKEIVDLIKFWAAHKMIEGNEWLLTWKLSTIGKYMAIFKAGELKVKQRMEDGYEKIT